jgi:hypothetical protein
MAKNVVNIQTSLDKLQSFDSDLRFMGFSDLNAAISDPSNANVLASDTLLTSNIIKGIVDKLEDPISEVQNQAMKW